uniref:Uncharacterized protein n=1 Tax=Parascaris univalens TaxID=6257 RepID=A0A915A1Z5_PARUN
MGITPFICFSPDTQGRALVRILQTESPSGWRSRRCRRLRLGVLVAFLQLREDEFLDCVVRLREARKAKYDVDTLLASKLCFFFKRIFLMCDTNKSGMRSDAVLINRYYC